MIKYMNGREISRYSSVKIRSHPDATTENLIDYVRPTARRKTKNGANGITNKSTPCRKLKM